jgi:hypothetical protein
MAAAQALLKFENISPSAQLLCQAKRPQRHNVGDLPI